MSIFNTKYYFRKKTLLEEMQPYITEGETCVSRNCSNWIKTYLEYTHHTEAPSLFRLWSAIWAIAGALRGKVWLDMGPFLWRPNFYIILVAPPGIATKSTAFGVASRFLYSCEGILPGPDSTTWQALTQYMAENVYEEVFPNGMQPMSNVALALSELGSFLKLDNLEMMDVLTDLWDGRDAGRPWRYNTRHSGEIVIHQPFVHFIGGTTPAWIAESFREHTIGGGFASRSISCRR